MARRYLLLLIPLGAFLFHALYLWGYTTDDAGISFTYARNLIQGHGLVLNPGEAPVEGYSNPLWTFLLALAMGLGIGPVGASKLMGIVFSGATVVLLPVVAADFFGSRPFMARILSPLALAGSTPFVLWTVGGLENSLMGFLLLVALWRTVLELRSRSFPLSAVLYFLIAITRPEGALFFGFTAVVRFWSALHGCRWVQYLKWVSIFGILFAVYHAWHYLYFGDIVPNTYYAKGRNIGLDQLTTWGSQGWDYILSWGRTYAGWTLALGLPFLLSQRHRFAGILLLGHIAVGLTATVYVGGDWMQEFRFLSHLLPLVYLTAQEGLLAVAQWVNKILPAPMTSGLALGSGLLLLVLWCLPSSSRSPYVLEHPLVPLAKVRDRALYFRQLASEAGLLGSASYADVDLGATSYFSGLRMVDLGGLADPVLARSKFDRKVIRRYVFEERKPTFIHIHGVWLGRLGFMQMPELKRDYLLLRSYVDSEGQNFDLVRREVLLAVEPPGYRWDLKAGAIQIYGYDWKTSEGSCQIDLLWRASERPRSFYAVTWMLHVDGDQVAAGSRPLLYGWLREQDWDIGQGYRDSIVLPCFSGPGLLTVRISGDRQASGQILLGQR